MKYKIGSGTDYHQLAEGRKLMIGGVEIPHHKGSVGHSDADVLLHAICDAMLGALGLGDIGKHFPDTDQSLKDIDSKILLQRSQALIAQHHYHVVNVDVTIILQAPKIAPYVPTMRSVIAHILSIPEECVSIKATTSEKMGFVGREEGLMAHAAVLLAAQNSIDVPVVYETGVVLPMYATEGSSGMDLRAHIQNEVTLRPGERKLVPTGIKIQLPQGYEAQIRPRSGLAIKHGITCLNTPGTIDSDYRGEIQVILINLGQEDFTIQPDDRIAQMVIAPVTKAVWIETNQVEDSSRGTGGFGHSGIK